jgi:hypothetical protein
MLLAYDNVWFETETPWLTLGGVLPEPEISGESIFAQLPRPFSSTIS